MAPAVVKMVAMPDAFEDSSKPSTTAPRSPANLLFPRAEPYRPPKAAQDAHINLLTYTREPPTRPFMSTGLAPTELDRHIRKAALLPGPGAYHPRLDAVAQRIRHVNIKETKSTSSPLLALARRKFPGPGAYEVAGDISRAAGVRFTRDLRSALGAREKTPGPGAYSVTRPSTSGGRMGPVPVPCDPLKRRQFADDGVAPGPDHYEPRRPKTAGGKIVSGSSRESAFDVAMRLRGEEPGPGHYDYGLAAAALERSDLGVTMSRAAPPSDLERTMARAALEPGPGAYRLPVSDRSPVAVKYKGPKGKHFDYYVPGPGDYDPSRIHVDPSAFFGSVTTADSYMALAEQKGLRTPGPGAYDVLRPTSSADDRGDGRRPASRPSSSEPGARFSTAPRNDAFAERMAGIYRGVPGPGAYNPPDGRKSNNPMAWLGSTLARRVVPNDVPGPGRYNPDKPDSRGTVNLGGTSARLGNLNVPNENPGPGAYRVDGDIMIPTFSVIGHMGSGTVKGDPSFEATLQRAASTPGPSDYSISSTLNRSGGRFAYTLNLDDDDNATVET